MDTLSSKTFYYLLTGGAMIDNDALNERFNANGIGEFSRYAGAIGFGSIHRFRRYVSVYEFESLLWKKNRADNLVGMLNAGRFTSLHGIQIVDKPWFSLYPLAGIGAGFTSIKAWPEEIPFDGALTDGAASATRSALIQATFLLDVGFGAHFSKSMSYGKSGSAMVGIRAGYIFDPVKSNRWYRDRSEVRDGPDGNLSGPYVRIILGGSRPHRSAMYGKTCCSSGIECKKHGKK